MDECVGRNIDICAICILRSAICILLKFLCNMVLESISFLFRRKISILHKSNFFESLAYFNGITYFMGKPGQHTLSPRLHRSFHWAIACDTDIPPKLL
jgi:hypothetical protein